MAGFAARARLEEAEEQAQLGVAGPDKKSGRRTGERNPGHNQSELQPGRQQARSVPPVRCRAPNPLRSGQGLQRRRARSLGGSAAGPLSRGGVLFLKKHYIITQRVEYVGRWVGWITYKRVKNCDGKDCFAALVQTDAVRTAVSAEKSATTPKQAHAPFSTARGVRRGATRPDMRCDRT